MPMTREQGGVEGRGYHTSSPSSGLGGWCPDNHPRCIGRQFETTGS